jgi:hypothetical protein
MTLLESFANVAAPNLTQQIDDAKTTAQQAAGAIAGWGTVVVIELAIIIWLLARRG